MSAVSGSASCGLITSVWGLRGEWAAMFCSAELQPHVGDEVMLGDALSAHLVLKLQAINITDWLRVVRREEIRGGRVRCWGVEGQRRTQGCGEGSGARMISQSNYYNLRKGNLDCWDA